MPLLPNKNSSDLTKKILTRALYSNYIIAQQAFLEGRTIHLPSGLDSETLTTLTAGPLNFKPSEINIILNENTSYSIPARPNDLAGTASYTEIVLTWKPPLNVSPPITSYRVSWTSTDGSGSVVLGLVTTTTITGLISNVLYSFTVFATNDIGDGQESTLNIPTLEYRVPYEITDLSGTAGDGQVVLTWTAPLDGGKPITSYTVTCSPSNLDGSGTFILSGPDHHTITIPQLTNDTSYSFTILATNMIGDGSGSTISITPTPPFTTSSTYNRIIDSGKIYYAFTDPSGSLSVNTDICATYFMLGGGGGGSPLFGGGGGAGGLLKGNVVLTNAYGPYSFTVGQGGLGGTKPPSSYTHGANGTDTTFSIFTAVGGGGGGGFYDATNTNSQSSCGIHGGCGGGGGQPQGGTGFGGSGRYSQGYAGADQIFTSGGGGGGVGGVGGIGGKIVEDQYGGAGGIGVLYAGLQLGGGGGGGTPGTTGGTATSGGGAGGTPSISSQDASGNTGGGGGGGTYASSTAGKGGSGIIILSFSPAPLPAPFISSSSYTTITDNSGTLYYVFTDPSGSLTMTSQKTATYFMIGGGGGGGTHTGGGGGAGGHLTGTLPMVTTTSYPFVIGRGGVGGIMTNGSYHVAGTNGTNTIFGGFTALGGGAGGTYNILPYIGNDGGCGGGGPIVDSNGGYGVSGQGYNGGKSVGITSGGGGGGIGGVGQDGNTATSSGGGGIGITYAGLDLGGGGGGGGDATVYGGSAGYGGGPGGYPYRSALVSSINGVSAIPNTGGGGGGGAHLYIGDVVNTTYLANGGNGANGVLILSFA